MDRISTCSARASSRCTATARSTTLTPSSKRKRRSSASNLVSGRRLARARSSNCCTRASTRGRWGVAEPRCVLAYIACDRGCGKSRSLPRDRGAPQQHPRPRAVEKDVGYGRGRQGHRRGLRPPFLRSRSRGSERSAGQMNYEGRVTRLQGELDSLDVQALLVTNLTNVRYLTGFSGSNGQVLLTHDGARFMTDGRYRARAKDLVKSAEVSIYSNRLTDVLEPMLKESGITRLGVEGKTMTLAERDDLALRLQGVDLVTARGLIEDQRRIKEPAEVEALRAAIALGDDAYAHIHHM